MAFNDPKEKKSDDFDMLKSQIENLKSLVDTEKNKEETKDQEDGDLLDSLSNDVEHYHKKVQLKKEKSHVKKEKIIARELEKERVQSEENRESSGEINNTHQGDAVDVSAITAAAAAVAAGKHQLEDEDEDEDDEDEDEDDSDVDDLDDEQQEFNGVPIEVNLKKRKGRPVTKKRRVNRSKKIYPWTKAEDEAIVYYKEDQKYSWKKIEEQLDYRHTWQAIQMRYLRNHKSRNEEWSRFMEVKLINAIRKDWENRWRRIGQDLGKDFSAERCIQKNIEVCKRMDMDYVKTIFENKEITTGYTNPFNDIKDAEAHKKLMLVYMGLDAITYEDSDEENDESGGTAQQDIPAINNEKANSPGEEEEEEEAEEEEEEEE